TWPCVTCAGAGVPCRYLGGDVGLAAAGRGLTASRGLAMARAHAIMSQSSLEAIQLPLMFIRMTVIAMTIGKAPRDPRRARHAASRQRITQVKRETAQNSPVEVRTSRNFL